MVPRRASCKDSDGPTRGPSARPSPVHTRCRHCTPPHCTPAPGGDEDILHIDLSSPRLRGLVAALAPTLVRIGGSRDNNVKYEFGNMTLAECAANTTFRGKPVSLCMNRTRWDEVLEFYNATGARMVFGLSHFTDGTGEWDSSNVEALLEYVVKDSGDVEHRVWGNQKRAWVVFSVPLAHLRARCVTHPWGACAYV